MYITDSNLNYSKQKSKELLNPSSQDKLLKHEVNLGLKEERSQTCYKLMNNHGNRIKKMTTPYLFVFWLNFHIWKILLMHKAYSHP